MNQILESCTSPETAFLAFAYPFGRQLKCVQRYWLETAANGAKKGEQRIVSQTTHISFNRMYTEAIDKHGQDDADKWARLRIEENIVVTWNAAKGSTYDYFCLMFLEDLGDGSGRLCVKRDGITGYSGPEDFARIRGIIGDQPLSEKRVNWLAMLNRMSRRQNPSTWAEWDAKQIANVSAVSSV